MIRASQRREKCECFIRQEPFEVWPAIRLFAVDQSKLDFADEFHGCTAIVGAERETNLTAVQHAAHAPDLAT
jgi:hypothetical protein